MVGGDGEECAHVGVLYLGSEALLAKTIQLLHLLDVQELGFCSLHSTGRCTKKTQLAEMHT